MLVYRVLPYRPSAGPGEAGHPLYEHRPQSGGRIDHPDYHVWYLGRRPEVAVGEAFGNLSSWDSSMVDVPYLPGAARALATMRLPDDLRFLDLDDPRVLVDLALKPTQVVARNLAVTQSWGHRIWAQTDPHDGQWTWQAVQWWSYHHHSWPVLASWLRPELVDVEDLSVTHPAIVDAARTLHRPLTRH